MLSKPDDNQTLHVQCCQNGFTGAAASDASVNLSSPLTRELTESSTPPGAAAATRASARKRSACGDHCLSAQHHWMSLKFLGLTAARSGQLGRMPQTISRAWRCTSRLARPASHLHTLGREGGSGSEGALRVAVEQLAAKAAGGVAHLLPQLVGSRRRCTAGTMQRTCSGRIGDASKGFTDAI